jgi:hypothetical protein
MSCNSYIPLTLAVSHLEAYSIDIQLSNDNRWHYIFHPYLLVGGCPPSLAGGINGARISHSISVYQLSVWGKTFVPSVAM